LQGSAYAGNVVAFDGGMDMFFIHPHIFYPPRAVELDVPSASRRESSFWKVLLSRVTDSRLASGKSNRRIILSLLSATFRIFEMA
jgi:hypothetical protein